MDREIISAIRLELKQQADEKTKNSSQRFFKEEITSHGVKTATVSAIARKYYQEGKFPDKREIFDLCEELLKSNYIEESFIACDWAYRLRAKYEQDDFARFERWLLLYVNNWATCDTLCNHTIGSFIDQYPAYIDSLKCWAKADNRWLKRASAVTLIIPAKRGKFLKDIFEIAQLLLTDKDDLVQKGYGWMLKEASNLHQTEVFNFIMLHKKVMPRTALRYAIEKMPVDLRQQAMRRD
jgi:3-methyladenine DNA glycosylase AlkD